MLKVFGKDKIKCKDITELENNMESNNNFICLSELECGKPAKIIKLQGNGVLSNRLRHMGIFSGAIIIKKSAILAKGPIIVEKGAMQLALEYDIAKKILVERL